MEEVLSSLIHVDVDVGQIGTFYHPRECLIISHLLYADDLSVFTNGVCSSLTQLLNILQVYENW